MLQEALLVLNQHGKEWFKFPKFFGMGADTKFQHWFWRAVLRILDKMPPVLLTFAEDSHPCTEFSPTSKEGQCLYDQLVEAATSLKSVKSLLAFCEKEGLLDTDQYLAQHPCTLWFTEFEILTLVAADEKNLLKWSSKWNIYESTTLGEIQSQVKSTHPCLISPMVQPALYQWYAVHLFAVPVNNVVAERQFNIGSIYLDPNQSELSKQASHLFVENVLHEPDEQHNLLETMKASRESNTQCQEFKIRITQPVRNHVRQQMHKYANEITPNLLSEARINLGKLQDKSSEARPLTAQDLFPQKLCERKTNKNHREEIDKLKKQGRSTELQWVAARKKDKGNVEEQRTFKPKPIIDSRIGNKVPTLMMLAACLVHQFGEEMPLINLPRECEMYVRFLPQIVDNKLHRSQLPQPTETQQQMVEPGSTSI